MDVGDKITRLSWADELAQVLRDRSYGVVDQDLAWVEALQQVRAWLGDTRPYTGQHKRPWTAALTDFRHATDRLGDKVRQELAPHLPELLSVLSTLPAGDARCRAVRAACLVDEILETVDAGRLLPPAWKDLVAAVRENAPFQEVRSLGSLLATLLHRSDRDVERLCRWMAGVLRDQLVDVRRAQLRLGDIAVVEPLRDIAGASAGLCPKDRADLCLRLLVAPPVAAHHVVWHAFGRAGISRMVEEFGPVTFFDGEWLRSNLTHDGPFRSSLPAETTSPDAFFPAEMLPEGKDVVVARVDLGVGARADAPSDSRLLVQSLILAAAFPEDRHGWQLYEGYIHAVDDQCGWEVLRLAEEDIENQMPYGPLAITAARLSEMAPRIAPHLVKPGVAMSEVIEAIGWWKASGTQPPHASVLLDVRILELLAARVDGTAWHRYLTEYHKDAWIRDRTAADLVHLVWHARDDVRSLGPKTAEAVIALHDSLVQHQRWGFRTDVTQAITALPALAAAYAPHTLQRRRTQDMAHRVSVPDGRRAWYTELEGRWSRAVNRLTSVRNALAHGGPATASAAANVAPMVHRLAGEALHASLTALLDGKHPYDGHLRRRDRAAEWAQRWLSETPPQEAWSQNPSGGHKP
ncbi:hypothetical protein [Streptomyces collinus]|uniref:hypothetical protein n=1 Tax=Streptomyces collinus TaxID=42684 RepID=UPI00380688E1